MIRTNEQLFALVEMARANKGFCGTLGNLSFEELGRIDKYFDTVMGATNKKNPDYGLLKEVRDELMNRVTATK